jgi:hypothetical protein
MTFDIPVQRTPIPVEQLSLFGVQTDVLGNRSPFSKPLKIGK